MADFSMAYRLLIKAEYSQDPEKFLHFNKGEDGFTLGGLYSKWHKEEIDWDFIDRVYAMTRNNIGLTSRLLYWDKDIQKQIYIAFENKYWRKYKLGSVKSQVVANKILLAVVSMSVSAIRILQDILNVEPDGIIGNITLRAINEYSDDELSRIYTDKLKETYTNIGNNNKDLKRYVAGWHNRAEMEYA